MKLREAGDEYEKRTKKMKEVVRKALYSAAQHGVADIVGVIIPSTKVLDAHGRTRKAPPVDRGGYKAGFRAQQTPNGARIIHINPPLAAILEFGVRAGNVKIGRAMIRALTAWVQRHSLDSQKHPAESIAWAIAKTFQRQGMAGRHVFEREVPRVTQFANEEVERLVKKAAEGD